MCDVEERERVLFHQSIMEDVKEREINSVAPMMNGIGIETTRAVMKMPWHKQFHHKKKTGYQVDFLSSFSLLSHSLLPSLF